jgi:uncharacterized membrane protein (Fun14 family)
MKVMFASLVLGSVFLGLAIAINNGLIVVSADKLAGLTASLIFIIGGLVGFATTWSNRPIQFRRIKRSRR